MRQRQIPKWVIEERRKLLYGRHPKQKFQMGDIVIVDNSKAHEVKLGMARSHFENGLGIIVGSYQDQYGHELEDDEVPENVQYTIIFKVGQSSWYPEETITLVKRRN